VAYGARAAGHGPHAPHVSAGVAQIADRPSEAREILAKAMPGWLRQGLGAM